MGIVQRTAMVQNAHANMVTLEINVKQRLHHVCNLNPKQAITANRAILGMFLMVINYYIYLYKI